MTSPILDESGNHIGVMTVTGPIFSADPADMEYLKSCEEDRHKITVVKLREDAVRARKVRKDKSSLLDMSLISPNMIANSLNELTFEERKLIEIALRNSDSVNLPYAVNVVSKTKELSSSTKHAIEVSMARAGQRLYNRGLATIEKRADSLIWCNISRERVLDIIRRERAKSGDPSPLNINLMKVPCEIPTISSGSKKSEKPRKIKHNVCDLPSRVSNERMKACRLLKGLRMLSRPDKVEVNYHFETYTADINEKIIALLDTTTGELIGSEYSTRFNDISKAAQNLNKFDAAMRNSFDEHSKACFLTLTTDPNLTDGERLSIKNTKIEIVTTKLKNSRLDPKARDALTKQLYRLEGPDFEICELEKKLQTILTKEEKRQIESRLSKLNADKEECERLMDSINDPNTPVRTREKMITSVKKMGRWNYTHRENGHESLWDANRSFSPAWNKFMSFLTKKNNGIRPQYIAAYEYTESGLLHVHALIFTEYLLSNDEISREWLRCGQGEISYIYSLKATPARDGKSWEWRWNAKSRPHDAEGMSGGDYLKKYIKKCMLALMDSYTSPSEIQSMYWAMNKRMFTCSRSLMDPTEKEQSQEETDSVKYAFWKIFTSEEALDVIDRMVYHRVRPGWSSEDETPDPAKEVTA